VIFKALRDHGLINEHDQLQVGDQRLDHFTDPEERIKLIAGELRNVDAPLVKENGGEILYAFSNLF